MSSLKTMSLAADNGKKKKKREDLLTAKYDEKHVIMYSSDLLKGCSENRV